MVELITPEKRVRLVTAMNAALSIAHEDGWPLQPIVEILVANAVLIAQSSRAQRDEATARPLIHEITERIIKSVSAANN